MKVRLRSFHKGILVRRMARREAQLLGWSLFGAAFRTLNTSKVKLSKGSQML